MSTRLKVGDTAPDFSLPSVDGRMVSLSDYRGRSIVIILLRSLS